MNAFFQNQAVLPRLVAERQGQFAEGAQREQAIQANMRGLGYGG